MAISDQMEMAFNGQAPQVDPVSGNEVPPGSLPVEVRDDIDVNLSEGEYIVPADVLRFHGVKFFEDLRAEAKMGLAGMDAAGRIGGEPVGDAPMDPAAMDPAAMGISDDDVAMLEQALSEGVPEAAMARGGLMDKVVFAALNDPLVNERINSKGMSVGFAAGGMTQSLYSDPTRIDSLSDKVMNAAQNNPSLLGELSKRGVTVNTTKANMQPDEMQQANTQPVGLGATPQPVAFSHGGLNHSGAPVGFTGGGGTAPTVPSKAEGGTGFNPFEYGLGFSSFGKTTPAGSVPPPVTAAPAVSGLGAPQVFYDKNGNPHATQALADAANAAIANSYVNMDKDKPPEDPGLDPKAWRSDFNYKDPNELYNQTLEALNSEQNFLEKILGATGIGRLGNAGELANLQSNIEYLKKRGGTAEQLEALQKAHDARTILTLGSLEGGPITGFVQNQLSTESLLEDNLESDMVSASTSSSSSSSASSDPVSQTSSSVINMPDSLKGDPSKSIFKKSAAERAEIQEDTKQSIKTDKNYGKDPTQVDDSKAKPIVATKSKDTSFSDNATGKAQKEREGDGSFGALNKGGLMIKKK